MSEPTPRPRRYIDLTLITQVPGDSTEAMEVVLRHLSPAPPVTPGFTRQEQLETEAREAAAEELDTRNRAQDELVFEAAKLTVQGRTIIGQLTTLLRTKPDVGTAKAFARADRALVRTLRTWVIRGFGVFHRPPDKPEEES